MVAPDRTGHAKSFSYEMGAKDATNGTGSFGRLVFSNIWYSKRHWTKFAALLFLAWFSKAKPLEELSESLPSAHWSSFICQIASHRRSQQNQIRHTALFRTRFSTGAFWLLTKQPMRKSDVNTSDEAKWHLADKTALNKIRRISFSRHGAFGRRVVLGGQLFVWHEDRARPKS